MAVERKEEEIEEESSQKKLFLYPSPFSESVYYQGTVSEYVGHEFKEIEAGRAKSKISSRMRKLFQRAYRSCLDSNSDTFHVDPSQALMTRNLLKKICVERVRFSTVIPEASIAGFDPGLLDEVYIYYLPEIYGCKRSLPQYKDDKKALRKELRALEAARMEPSTADYPIRCHQDIINTYAAMTEEPVAKVKKESQDLSDIQNPVTRVAPMPHFTAASQSIFPSTPQMQSVESLTRSPQFSQSQAPMPLKLIQMSEKQPDSPAKIKLKIKKESSPLKISFSKPIAPQNDVLKIDLSQTKSSSGLGENASITEKASTPSLTTPDGQIRCICQHSSIDFGRFMIACDICEIWFHGECVNVTAESVQEGAQWLCLRCSAD